jgi:hypothetical protein
VQQFGIWPEHLVVQAHGKQRLAEVKAGSGAEITVCDLTGQRNVLADLSLGFVKAKAAVQLRLKKGDMQEEAFENLATGVTELLLADKGIAQGPVADGRSEPNQKSPSPEPVELGRMEAAIIVHPENPLASLPIEEVRAILCGEVKKWPAVRGAAAAMHVFGLKRGDPITQLLKEKLVESGGRKSLKYTAPPDNEKVILAVARGPAAIGFVDLSQLPPEEKSVKLVPVIGGESGREGGASESCGERGEHHAQAEAKLKASPDDGDAHLLLGRCCCLDDDWKKGLPHLAKGSDAQLRQLAEQDVASPKETAVQLRLADGWWTLGEARQGEEADALRLRAGYWYDRAHAQLTSGFNRLKVEKRLEELVKIRQRRAAQPYHPGENSPQPPQDLWHGLF